MYLSRIGVAESIAERTQLGLLLKGNSYGIHRLLWDLFEKKERFLFREENAREQLATTRSLPIYYVVSDKAPAAENPLFRVESKPYNPIIETGDMLGFTLRANPTIARNSDGSTRSRRHDVVIDAQRRWLMTACSEQGLPAEGSKSELRQSLGSHKDYEGPKGAEAIDRQLKMITEQAAINWMKARGVTNGFELQSSEVNGYRWHALPEKGRGAGFSSVDYTGVLKVTDPSSFKNALRNGLGPAKAFGCGLLLIRRVS